MTISTYTIYLGNGDEIEEEVDYVASSCSVAEAMWNGWTPAVSTDGDDFGPPMTETDYDPGLRILRIERRGPGLF